jgi:DNA repair exonuclease SbcCD nuclease subunit
MKLKNKIGCFSDIHLGLGQDSNEWHSICLEFFQWASATFRKRDIYDIIIPGDIFHNRSHISVETLSIAKKCFDLFQGFNIYISTGNHDCYLKDTSDINSISILNGWENIKVFEHKPELLETENFKKIALVPWGSSLDDIPKADYMFGHFEISSFYMNSYKICEHGFSYKDLFKISPFILSGHFHKKDDRSYNDGRIVYLGSPYQQNFGDVMDERGIYILDTDKNELEFIENNVSPKHYKVKINEDLNENIIKNNFISLVIDNNIDDDEMTKFKSKLLNFKPKNVKIQYQEFEEKINEFKSQELDSLDLMKNIEEYIENLELENKKEVVEYIKTMYNSLI